MTRLAPNGWCTCSCRFCLSPLLAYILLYLEATLILQTLRFPSVPAQHQYIAIKTHYFVTEAPEQSRIANFGLWPRVSGLPLPRYAVLPRNIERDQSPHFGLTYRNLQAYLVPSTRHRAMPLLAHVAASEDLMAWMLSRSPSWAAVLIS
jgi:hypothetical protein